MELFLGSDNSESIIVEYASLTCPHCATFHGDVFPRIKSELIDTGKVKYIFRDYPIDPLAMAGSMIAHCSGDTMYFGVIDVLLNVEVKLHQFCGKYIWVCQLFHLNRELLIHVQNQIFLILDQFHFVGKYI